MSQLAEHAKAWLDQDPDPVTKLELQALIDNQDEEGLSSRFSTRLDFGTAGLRGELGAGPNRMNRVVVAQTALGLAKFLNANRETYLDPSGGLSAVIGFDGRTNSDVFALDSAKILSAAGIKTFLFSDFFPTPVAAFTVSLLFASLTVFFSSIHNPPLDYCYYLFLVFPTGVIHLVPPPLIVIAYLFSAPFSSTHLLSHYTTSYLVCRLLLEKKKKNRNARTRAGLRACVCAGTRERTSVRMHTLALHSTRSTPKRWRCLLSSSDHANDIKRTQIV